jgi:uncharacterized protein YggE
MRTLTEFMPFWIRRQFLLGCALSLLVFDATADAQPRAPRPPSVRASARATIHATPDQAEIDLGVVTRAETSQRASSQNAQQLKSVLSQVRMSLGQAGNIRSVAYSIRPDYSRPKDTGESTISGYTATNIVRVTITDLTKLSDVIDTATAAGANRVEGVRFSLQKENAIAAQALREAATKARAQADTLASALGVRVVRVLAASEERAPVRPFAETAMLARAENAPPATPIEVGPIEITATVTLTVEVSSAPAP